MHCLRCLALLLLPFCFAAGDDSFPPIRNTQNPKDTPPPPAEAVAKITVPAGFRVTLFAGEPEVQQPIAMSIDDRGRLWVAECYTYSGASGAKCWVPDHRDRLVIFEDADLDGKHDKRKVFTDCLQNLSSVAHGFGGLWVLCAPHLLFIPDRNGDDVPDGPPEVVLDGFNVKQVGHNVVNGLLWGPDGWLYGRHGIMATSLIGRPGTPDRDRVKINCGIWRYHPTKKIVEAVCHGTTNPWGMDYNEQGELFFTNNVNGHLWHVIPGAHYKRMYGEDFNPRTYELLDQHADHHHWDTSKPWFESRDAKGKNSDLGGGHSHVGALIYQADAWPKEYRGLLLMCNTHGRRVNINRLERSGSGYVGRRHPDFLFANQPWFRGIDLKLAPDGNVYLSDWCDLGECHDHDGVHRTSGRIYKVIFGKVTVPEMGDLSQLGDEELVELQRHANEYFVRTARRILQERAAAGKDLGPATAQLLRWVSDQQRPETERLRALWTLRATGKTDRKLLWTCLQDQQSEHLRAWALRFLVEDGEKDRGFFDACRTLACKDSSGLVRLYLAAALQRLPLDHRGGLIEALVSRAEDAGDHNLPLMIWYGTEPWVAHSPERAVSLLPRCQIPLIRRFIARRLAESIETQPVHLTNLLRLLPQRSEAVQYDVLRGLSEGLRGQRKVKPPQAWATVQSQLEKSPHRAIVELVRELGVVFGDGRALTDLYRLVQQTDADGDARRAALRALITARPDDLLPVLLKLLGDRATAGTALAGLASFDDPRIPKAILQNYRLLQPEERSTAISTLASRPLYARALLKAVADGTVPRTDLSAFHARQVHSLGDAELQKELARTWGEVRSTSAEKKQLMERYRRLLTTDQLKKANLTRGHLLYQQVCANCHKLNGEGLENGPDLTGAGRDNLDYLLENIVDPSAVVAADFRMSVVVLKSGRVITGLVGSRLGKTLTVQTQNEKLTLQADDIEEIRPTTQSLMPEGLLQTLTDEQVRDLFGYLMKK